ncbi:STAS domain-containing protein [Actinoplanes xinjiangensis]|uniref:STAS domain-containing protein n=1 Tax=Actinoplanes xinjiangensis TaxID=512350 RepID=UPI0034323E09
MNDLTITTSTGSTGSTRVRIAGEIDIATAPHITDTVHDTLAAGAREVLLDMADVTFLDSTGIGAQLHTKHAAVDQDVTLRLVDPNPRVVRVLQLTGLLDVLQDGAALHASSGSSAQPVGSAEPVDTAKRSGP